MIDAFAQLFRPEEIAALPRVRYERLRQQAAWKLMDATWVFPLVMAVIAGVLWLGLGFGIAYAASAVATFNRPNTQATSTSTSTPVVPGAAGWVPTTVAPAAPIAAAPPPQLNLSRVGWVNTLCALVAGIVAWTIVRERIFNRAILKLLHRASCPFCEFSLLGLTPSHGAVRCPECGQVVVLHQHRITELDLVVPGGKPKPAPNAGPLGSFTGEVPRGRSREIRRPYGSLPRSFGRGSSGGSGSGGGGGGSGAGEFMG